MKSKSIITAESIILAGISITALTGLYYKFVYQNKNTLVKNEDKTPVQDENILIERKKFETTEFSENKNSKWPSDFIHALLSAHSYEDVKQGEKVKFEIIDQKIKNTDTTYSKISDFLSLLLSRRKANNTKEEDIINESRKHDNADYNIYLEGWHIERVFAPENSEDYLSVLYINHENKWAVLAQRGTDIHSSIKGQNSSLLVDFNEILNKNIGVQLEAAFDSIKITTNLDIIKKGGYTLSLTGHSLGAWLAELSLYICHQKFNYYKVKAVTFDSPGSKDHIEKILKPNMVNSDSISVQSLDIVTYLSAPNIVNVCNEHIGYMYRIFPQISLPKHSSLIPHEVQFRIDAILSVSGHALDPMLKVFDPNTGKPYPNKCKKIYDWPLISHNPTIYENIKITSNLASQLIIPQTLHNTLNTVKLVVPQIYNDTLKETLFVLISFISTNTNLFQLFETFRNLDINTGEYDLSTQEQKMIYGFGLLYKGHYDVRDIEKCISIKNLDKYKPEWYLLQLQKCNDFNWLNCSNEIKTKLRVLKNKYEVKVLHQTRIMNSSSFTIEELKQDIENIFRLDLAVEEQFQNIQKLRFNYYDQCVEKNITNQLADNYFMLKVENFIKRNEIFIRTDNILSQHDIVIFSGLPGVGKSSFVNEYSRYIKNTNPELIIRFFSAENIFNEYLQLAEDIGKSDSNLTKKQIINRIYAYLKSQKEMIFVFEDVNNYKDIKEYLINKPTNIKILITSRKSISFPQKNLIQLEPFNLEESINYLRNSLNDIIDERIAYSELKKIAQKVGDEEGNCLPFHLNNIVKWFQQPNNYLKSIDDYLHAYGEGKDDDKTTELLLATLDKSNLVGKIIQCISYLNPDFIDKKIISKIVNNHDLQGHMDLLIDLGLIISVRKISNSGIKIHRLTQTIVKKYILRHKEDEELCFFKHEELLPLLIQSLEELMPELNTSIRPSDDEWILASTLYPHIIQITSEKIIYDNESLLNCNLKSCEQLASLYSKLGRYSFCIMHQYRISVSFYNKALEYKLQTYDINSSEETKLSIIKTLTDIGKAYNMLGENNNSLEIYKIAEKYITLDNNPNSSEVAILYCSMAKAYENLHNNSDNNYLELCIEYANKSLEINQQLNDNKEIAESFNTLAGIYDTCFNPRVALKFYNESLNIRKNLYNGDVHQEIANVLNNIGLLYHSQALPFRDIQDGKGTYGYRTLKDILHHLHHTQNKALTDICNFFVEQKFKDLIQIENRALFYLNESLLMFKKIYGEFSPIIGEISFNLGICHRYLSNVEYNLKHKVQAKDYEDKAIESFTKAAIICKELYPEGHVQTVKALNSLGLIFTNLGYLNQSNEYYEKASKYYKEALMITCKLDPQDYKVVVEILNDNITELKLYFDYNKYTASLEGNFSNIIYKQDNCQEERKNELSIDDIIKQAEIMYNKEPDYFTIQNFMDKQFVGDVWDDKASNWFNKKFPNGPTNSEFNSINDKEGIINTDNTEAVNYSFCTIEQNTSTVSVPDERIHELGKVNTYPSELD